MFQSASGMEVSGTDHDDQEHVVADGQMDNQTDQPVDQLDQLHSQRNDGNDRGESVSSAAMTNESRSVSSNSKKRRSLMSNESSPVEQKQAQKNVRFSFHEINY